MDLINYKSTIGNPTFNGNIKMKICRLVVFPIAKFHRWRSMGSPMGTAGRNEDVQQAV